jgi:hypothetical protein
MVDTLKQVVYNPNNEKIYGSFGQWVGMMIREKVAILLTKESRAQTWTKQEA